MSARRAAALALVVLGLAAAVAASRLRVDNRLEMWLDSDPAAARTYQEFRQRFGSDEFVVVALSGRPLFDPDELDAMVDALGRLEALPAVIRVDGLPEVYRDRFGSEDPEALREEMTSTPFYRGLFLSAAGDVAGLLVQIDPDQDADARHRVVEGLRAALEPVRRRGFQIRMVGSTVLADTLDEVSRREALRTFPVALLLSMVALAVLLRSVRGMVVAAACSGLTVILALGLMAALGRPLTMVSSALPSLLWVLALSNSVHLLLRYRRLAADRSRAVAVEEALAEKRRPCTLAALTTALGFVSLAVADLAPVREVGLFAAFGLLASLPVNLWLGPELILLLRVPARASLARAGVRWSSRAVLARPRRVLGVTAMAAAVAAAAVPFIRVESNPLSFLPAGNRLTRAYQTVGEELTGFYSLEVVVDTPQAWTSPPVLEVLEGLGEHIAASPIVAKVLTPLDLLRKLRQWRHGFDPAAYALPSSAAQAEDLLAGLDQRGEGMLRRLVAGDGRWVRLSAVVDEMDAGRFLDLVRSTRREIASLPTGYSGSVTGMVLRLVEGQQHLVASQLRSLGLAFVVIFTTIAVGLRSWRLTLVSIPPNLLPVLVTFAMMALTRVPLDAATVMVASVALGIAVDNTVHVLTGYGRQRRAGEPAGAAAQRTLERVGSAMVITSLAAAIGFFSLCFSAFIPIRDFGVLAGVTMVVALAADLLLVPAMLVVGRAS